MFFEEIQARLDEEMKIKGKHSDMVRICTDIKERRQKLLTWVFGYVKIPLECHYL